MMMLLGRRLEYAEKNCQKCFGNSKMEKKSAENKKPLDNSVNENDYIVAMRYLLILTLTNLISYTIPNHHVLYTNYPFLTERIFFILATNTKIKFLNPYIHKIPQFTNYKIE
jgi:hypothetical protein